MTLNATTVKIASFARVTSGTDYLTAPVRVDDRGLGGERTASGKRAVLTIARMNDGAATTAVEGTVGVYGANLTNPLTGTPVGNAFASATNPTSFVIVGDGTATTFQTNIPYVAWNSNNNWIVDTVAFKVTGTFAVTTAGAATASGTTGSQVKLGDVVQIGGHTATISAFTSVSDFTVTPAPAAAISGAAAINLSKDRRLKTWITSGSLSTTNPELFTVTDVGGFALISFAVAPPKVQGTSLTTGIIGGQTIDQSAAYYVVPVEIKAAAANLFERVGVKATTVMWVRGTQATNILSATNVILEHGAE